MITDDIATSPIHGTDWIVTISLSRGAVIVSTRLPDYASPQFIDAWHAQIAAQINGRCALCDAVASIHPDLKTMEPGVAALVFYETVPHTVDCPASEGGIAVLERACSPNGETFVPDTSPAKISLLGDHLEQLALWMRQQGLLRPPTVDPTIEEYPC